MAYQKLQVSQGLNVIPSDTVDIPEPDSIVVPTATPSGPTIGVADFSVAGSLTDVGTKFTEAGIKIGAIVYNTTANKAYHVTEIVNDLRLNLSPSSAGGATDSYSIYNEGTNGCILYVGTAGNLAMSLAGVGNTPNGLPGDRLTFKNLPNASFLPTQVKRVRSTNTTASDIIALW